MPKSPLLSPLLLIAALALQPVVAQEAPAVRLATNVERSYFPPAEALLRKAYASLGLQVEFVPWPLQRAQVELNAGRLDGVAMRAEAFFTQTPAIRKVDVPLLTLNVYAFGRPPCPTSLAPEDLARRRITYQRGMVAVELMVPEASRLPANTPSDAFLNTSIGAADYALVLTTPWMAEVPLQTRQGKLCRVATPLSRTLLYHGVHESQAERVAPLEQALRAMRDRGEIQQAWSAYEREIAAQNTKLEAQPGRSLTLTPATPGSAPAQPPR
ncbi:substrate-binding periplasmic protein [Roseateles sp. BYS78W]|uniref:Substrate-binding periplasmic protein n=1 Tax=Pelomonas candidula TaxID=3299025 RepID=A0ABW7HK61_9BURK